MNAIYTAETLATGAGRDGHVRSADGLVDMDLAIPKEMGGQGGAANPELLFAAGYAACFHSALQMVALADKAHEVCPYSNATRGNIDVKVSVVED